ncbi:DUF6320 domain-containing protein [uncultured Oscillibacter sp.]|uniref:DUF6320 domain-containing protein n=1 Tax=uncultured Oscillibacter sp. TaxID=876091 RepID=UPI0025CC5C87|nr:DUF6320 domain-containing protein [uncultured Oscillibacter sp.]
MQTCPYCRVRVAGVKRCCPLCGGVLEGTGDPESEVFPLLEQPRFAGKTVLRLLALLGVAATTVCVLVNIALGTRVWWSLFVAAGALCVFLAAAVGIAYRRDILQNIAWQTVLVPTLGVFLDLAAGWQGWSLDFVLPCVCATGLLMMLLLAVLLRLPVQSFAGAFSGVCSLGLLPGVLAALGRVRVMLPSLICTGLSVILLAAMVLLHWQTFRGEAARRFHL